MGWERKPRILLLSDVPNWAWAIKSNEIKTHISDEFDIDIVHLLSHNQRSFDVNRYDLYVTFGWSYVGNIRAVPMERRVSGVTAHKGKEFFKNNIAPALRNVKWHHANSILLKQELEAAGFKNVFYVPNGVNEQKFRIITPIPEKRDNLIAGHVGKKCGQGTDAKGHKNFIEPACKSAGVQYVGHYNNYKNHVPHEKMVDLYQKIDIFIVASETDGTPNGALEAAACGRPILSNDIGNMPEFIKNGYNGFIVNRNVGEYKEKLVWCKANRDKLIEMGNNARKTIEEGWTWKIMSENYRKMFNKILLEIGVRK
jgi:glycosyltransferase involved in cell wall biosynthesis